MNLRFADKGDMRVTGKEAFMLALGVIGSSRKEHEQRLPLLILIGAGAETRTRTGFPPGDFKC